MIVLGAGILAVLALTLWSFSTFDAGQNAGETEEPAEE
jgi:hypothetical protein